MTQTFKEKNKLKEELESTQKHNFHLKKSLQEGSQLWRDLKAELEDKQKYILKLETELSKLKEDGNV